MSIIVIAFWKYRMLWKSTISKKMMAKPEEREFRKESVFLIYDPLKVAVKSSQFASTWRKNCAPHFSKSFPFSPLIPWILVACEIDFRKDLLLDSTLVCKRRTFISKSTIFPLSILHSEIESGLKKNRLTILNWVLGAQYSWEYYHFIKW